MRFEINRCFSVHAEVLEAFLICFQKLLVLASIGISDYPNF